MQNYKQRLIIEDESTRRNQKPLENRRELLLKITEKFDGEKMALIPKPSCQKSYFTRPEST